ncbi:MAG: HAD family hydrolase [Hyphomicrobiaceae bacterium]
MPVMEAAAVIFDVDGPLLDLTVAEEEAFFRPFEKRYGLTGLSTDWDSYRIRNDVEIYREILEGYLGRVPTDEELTSLAENYFQGLRDGYDKSDLDVVAIDGALTLLERLGNIDGLALGTATANFGEAARQRLKLAGMWPYVSLYPGAADGGGSKSDILARVIAELGLRRDRIVFLGDNLNDLEAGQSNGVHFIGFHVDQARRDRLSDAGAKVVAGDHETTWVFLQDFLGLA